MRLLSHLGLWCLCSLESLHTCEEGRVCAHVGVCACARAYAHGALDLNSRTCTRVRAAVRLEGVPSFPSLRAHPRPRVRLQKVGPPRPP